MIDILMDIYLGILLFLSAAVVIGLVAGFIALTIWTIKETFKDMFV